MSQGFKNNTKNTMRAKEDGISSSTLTVSFSMMMKNKLPAPKKADP